MGAFRGLPIKQKLVLMIMATSMAALVLASIGYILIEYSKARDDLRRELTVQAQVLLTNSTGALEFNDQATAQETLRTIASNPHIRSACLYDRADRLFSQYLAPSSVAPCPSAPGPDGYFFQSERLLIVASIALQGRRAGSLLLRSDLELLRNSLRARLLIAGLLLAFTTGIALLMSSRLHSIVSGPITALARTATEVSSAGDYSLRATRTTEDELGVLVDAFNRMLERIQLRERELSAANEDLRNEITERRRAEQERAEMLVREREANRLKDEFLATLSHELRTPLNAILGWTKLLRSSAIPPSGFDRALEKVERNALVQSRLVEDLLEVSRITTGKLRLDVKPLDLVALVLTAVESIRPTADARGIAIDREFMAASLPTAGDPDRLQQVIWNLLSNAVKFSHAGAAVTVGLRRDGSFDELFVSDTGIGIDAGFLPNVFETFRQADASSTRAQGGLGLGLSIVRHLVEMHGGEVKAASAGIGQGSRFVVRLPVRTADAARERSGPVSDQPAGLLDGADIVVVDDDGDVRDLLQSVLESAGATVRVTSNAEDAFQACAASRRDALISDLAMPGEDGYGLIPKLHRMLGPDMPRATVALTAFAGAAELAASAGFDRQVAKPFDPETLVRLLREMLTSNGALMPNQSNRREIPDSDPPRA